MKPEGSLGVKLDPEHQWLTEDRPGRRQRGRRGTWEIGMEAGEGGVGRGRQ